MGSEMCIRDRSIINRWLGDGIDGEPWGAINSYLPDRPSQYKNYNIVAKYDESEDIQGIRVHFKGKFSSTIKNLAKQVVFKISDSDENVLIAKLLNGREEYDIPELSKSYKVLSWTMTRIISAYEGVNHESAFITMEWAWEGEIEKGAGIKRLESTLQWTWHPYQKDR